MEEDIKIVKEIKKEFITKMKKDITHNDNPIYYRNIQALQNILNELERYKRIKPVDLDGEYTLSIEEFLNVSDKLYELERNSIPKHVIRDKFKRINETKIKIDKTNARDYMIFGNTERATGWFINIDYIEKILLDVPGYKIGDE